jgi:hypothetical protein
MLSESSSSCVLFSIFSDWWISNSSILLSIGLNKSKLSSVISYTLTVTKYMIESSTIEALIMTLMITFGIIFVTFLVNAFQSRVFISCYLFVVIWLSDWLCRHFSLQLDIKFPRGKRYGHQGKQFSSLAFKMLNVEIRPFTTKWHKEGLPPHRIRPDKFQEDLKHKLVLFLIHFTPPLYLIIHLLY